jgi:hypothetical protein
MNEWMGRMFAAAWQTRAASVCGICSNAIVLHVGCCCGHGVGIVLVQFTNLTYLQPAALIEHPGQQLG